MKNNLDSETDDLNPQKKYRLRFQDELNERETENGFLDEKNDNKNLSEKFFKEQENQFSTAEKLLNADIETQESNFKARLIKKLEIQKVFITIINLNKIKFTKIRFLNKKINKKNCKLNLNKS